MQLSDFPGEARCGGISFTLQGKAYYGLGGNLENSYLTDIWVFDPGINSWEQKEDFPFDLPAEVALTTSNKAYVITYSGSLYEYNPAEDSWIYFSSFPPGNRPGITGFSLGNTLFFGTGNDVTYEVNHYSDFWKFEPTSKEWTKLNDFPGAARTEACSFVVNGKGYLGMGFSAGAPPIYGDLWEYNAISDSWIRREDLPMVNSIVGIHFSSSTKAYVALPDNTESRYRAITYEFDPAMNSWRKVKDFPSINSVERQSFSVDGRLFTVGGFWSTHSKEVWEFIP